MQIYYEKIDNIIPYANNAKEHPQSQVKLIAESIKRFGFAQPIVVDKNNEIVVGHGRLLGAKLLGMKEVPCIKVENLTDQEVKAYRMADNQINALSGNNMTLIVDELKLLDDELIDLTGFDKDLILEPEDIDDEVPETPTEPKSKLGDIYEIGKHRILCGDSTKIQDVELLMNKHLADIVVTDPPYNTGMQGKEGDEKAWLSHMFNDKIENWEEFLSDVFTNYTALTKGDCAFYVFIDWRRVNDIRSEMEKHVDVKNVIVWDKKVHGLGSDYKSTYELCIVGKKGKPEINNRYGLDYQDIWRLQREMGRNKDHATAKPVELIEKPIIHASKAEQVIRT